MNKTYDAPILMLGGHSYTMITPKVKNWYDFAKFDDESSNLSVSEYIHGVAECIAGMYDGVTAEDVINGLALEDLKLLFLQLYKTLVTISNKAFDETKNGEKAAN